MFRVLIIAALLAAAPASAQDRAIRIVLGYPPGASSDSFRLSNLLGDNTARLIQLVWRVRW